MATRGSVTSGHAPEERVAIAVGVVMDEDRKQVLLARRPGHLRHGGLWEFPGGKQEPDESMEAALQRELLEELNLQVIAARRFLRVAHDYPDLSVDLHVWLVTEWQGNVRGMEGQLHEWVPVSALHERDFPEANLPIITALQLPRLYLVTPDLEEYGQQFFADARAILAAGTRLLQFRSLRLPAAGRPAVLRRLAGLCREHAATLLINGSVAEVLESGAGGLHLTAARQMEMHGRPVSRPLLLGVSCHDAAELGNAERMGADFAVLGPVSATRSHPGRPPLGWASFTEIIGEGRRVPVFAIGGIGAGDMSAVRGSGAWGAAMISGIWSAGDPAAAANRCLENLARAFRR
jgi:8-oxo-dGTP diphosphatase